MLTVQSLYLCTSIASWRDEQTSHIVSSLLIQLQDSKPATNAAINPKATDLISGVESAKCAFRPITIGLKMESDKDDPVILHRVLPQDVEEYIAIPESEVKQKLFDIYVRIGYTVAEAQERVNCDLEGFTHPAFL